MTHSTNLICGVTTAIVVVGGPSCLHGHCQKQQASMIHPTSSGLWYGSEVAIPRQYCTLFPDSKPAMGGSKINICLCKLELLNLLNPPSDWHNL